MVRLCLIFITGLAFHLPIRADIYSWEDANGHIHYSDQANENSRKLDIVPGYAYRIVDYVYDGDTVQLAGGNKVRLSGINTPEVQTSRKDGEPGGVDAKHWLSDRIQGKKVRLEVDNERKDRYHRYLAHLFTEKGNHINLELVAKGLATVNIHPPNLKYTESLLNAQKQAERQRLGIWGMREYAPVIVDEQMMRNRRGWQRLLGTPVAIRPGRKYDRLIFNQNFDVRIPKNNLVFFPDLKTYVGRALELRGWVSRRSSKYSMLIRHPSSLVAPEIE